MVPPLQILDDLGKDTGAYAGQAGRTGPSRRKFALSRRHLAADRYR